MVTANTADQYGAEHRCYQECPTAWHLAKAMQSMGRGDPRFKEIWKLMSQEERDYVTSWGDIVKRGYRHERTR